MATQLEKVKTNRVDPEVLDSEAADNYVGRILHVDDELDFLFTTKQILELQGGYRVKSVQSVDEALDLLKGEDFDVIISDYQMPEKDGLDFLRQLTELGKEIPFILFTGRGREEIAIEALNLGANQYINKIGNPATVYPELIYSINKLIELKHKSEELTKKTNDLILMNSINAAINRGDSLQSIINQLSNETEKMFSGSNVTVYLLSEDKKHLFLQRNTGIDETIKKVEKLTRKKISPTKVPVTPKSHYFQALHLKKPQLFNSPETIQKLILEFTEAFQSPVKQMLKKQVQKIQRILNVKSVMTVPLVAYGDPIGLVDIPSNKEFTLDDLERFQIITEQLTIAIKRKMEQEQIRKQNKLFANTINSLPYPFYVFDADDYTLKISNDYAILNSPEPGLITCHGINYSINKPCSDSECLIEKVKRTKNPVIKLQRECSRDGTEKFVQVHGHPIFNSNEKIEQVIVFCIDVTDQKNNENQLRNARNRYYAFFDQSPVGILIIDSEGKAVEFNDKAYRQLGYSREEFEKLTISDYEILETPDETKARMKKIIKEGKDEFETKYRTKNGEIRNVKNYVHLIEIDGKKLFHVITQDITAYKEAEKLLQENEKKYRQLMNGMNDTAWVVDVNTVDIIDVNDAAVNVLGYSRKELLSMSIVDIDNSLSPEDIHILRKNMPTDEVQVFETSHVAKDGKTIPVEISSSMVTYKGKKAILSIARDISERKKAEEELNNTMEKLVSINEKLGVVGKLTRHDTRNKLSIIANNIYLAKMQLAKNSKVLEYFQSIELAIDQIGDIFHFSRTYERLGVEELSIQSVTKCFNKAIGVIDSNNEVKLVNGCRGLSVLADSLLWELFYNLIENSIKHGKSVTKIKVHHQTSDNSLILLYEDNGVGIPFNEKKKIFEKGYGKGSGLGLFLIEKMCKTYGWKISETGTFGKGVQFRFEIPKGKFLLDPNGSKNN